MFVGIHRKPLDSPHKGPVMWTPSWRGGASGGGGNGRGVDGSKLVVW